MIVSWKVMITDSSLISVTELIPLFIYKKSIDFPKGSSYHYEKNVKLTLSWQKKQMSTKPFCSCIPYHSLNTWYIFPFPALVYDVCFCLKLLSHTSTYWKFKVHLKLYSLYLAWQSSLFIFYSLEIFQLVWIMKMSFSGYWNISFLGKKACFRPCANKHSVWINELPTAW